MSGRVVLVTGSSRGIGKAIAERFVHDSLVVLNCVKNKALMDESVKNLGGRAVGIQADVSVYDEADFLFKEIFRRFGRIDVLINNAGISHIGLFNMTKPIDYETVMRVNFNSVMNCSYIAVNDMLKRKNGVIINISSVWGAAGASCEVVYSASKGAVNAFTKALAKELAPSGIRVNAIAPGIIQTDMNKDIDSMDELINNVPMLRTGAPEEIAELAYFLAGGGAGYITGQVITVDGGWM